MEENNDNCAPVKMRRRKKNRSRSSSIFYVNDINIDNQIKNNDKDNNDINTNLDNDKQSDNISIIEQCCLQNSQNPENSSTPSISSISSSSFQFNHSVNSNDANTKMSLKQNSLSPPPSSSSSSSSHLPDIAVNNTKVLNVNSKKISTTSPKRNYVQQLKLKFEKLNSSSSSSTPTTTSEDKEKLLQQQNNKTCTSPPKRNLRTFVRSSSNGGANYYKLSNNKNNNNNNKNNNKNIKNNGNITPTTTEIFSWNTIQTLIKRRTSSASSNASINSAAINLNGTTASEEEVDEIISDCDEMSEVDALKARSYYEAINELSRNSMSGEITHEFEVKNVNNTVDDNVLDEKHECEIETSNDSSFEIVPKIFITKCQIEENLSGNTSFGENDFPDKNKTDDKCDKKTKKKKKLGSKRSSLNRPKTEIYETKNYNVLSMSKSHSYQGYSEIKNSSESDSDAFEKKSSHSIEKNLSNETQKNFTYSSNGIEASIQEIIRSEEIYINTLREGIKNYGKIFNSPNCPKGLKGKKFDLFGNIEEIIELHENVLLPMIEENYLNLEVMFDKFAELIENNVFYSYVLFTIHKRKSAQLCEEFCAYFKEFQNEINDNLGIISFLVQPIQKITRYHLLFNEFLKQSFGNFEYRSAAGSCAKLIKRILHFNKVLDEAAEISAIEDCFDLNISYQGKFKKADEFQIYDYTNCRSYRTKLFIFEKSLIYTEIKKDRLVYRGCYPYDKIGFLAKLDAFILYRERRKKQECDFKADAYIVQNWIRLITEMSQLFADEEKLRLQEIYLTNCKQNNNEHEIYRPPNSILFWNSNRASADSGISGMATPITPADEGCRNTTWYDTL